MLGTELEVGGASRRKAGIVDPTRCRTPVHLDRKIADRRIFPAVDILKSGTRKEELLLTQAEINRVFLLRNFLSDMPEPEQIEFLLKQMKRTKDNKEFFVQMAQGG